MKTKQLSPKLALGSIVLSLFIAITSQGRPLEIRSMKEIEPYVTEKSLVIFDLDNTIIEPKQMLGSDQWFEQRFKNELKKSKTKQKALDDTLVVWRKLQDTTPVQAVEKTTPALIRSLQARGVSILGLTSRSSHTAKTTYRQLKILGVDFYTRRIYPKDLTNPDLSAVQYRKGIIFSSGHNKGEVLVTYLKKFNLHPKRILFIDDKRRHVENVDAALKNLPVEHFEFRYGAADPKVNAYDAGIAATELCLFEKTGKFVPDTAAKSARCP